MAASRIFRLKGFHAARTADICAEAGLSAGTVFRHFSDKRTIIATIANRELAHFQQVMQRLSTREGLQRVTRMSERDLAEFLRPTAYDLGFDSRLELYRDEKARIQLMAVVDAIHTALAATLAGGQQEGWVRKAVDPAGLANMILAVFLGLTVNQAIGAPTSSSSTAAALANLFRSFIHV